MGLVLFFLWFGSALACMSLAGAKNRDPATWFATGTVGGIFSLLVLLGLPRGQDAAEAAAIERLGGDRGN